MEGTYPVIINGAVCGMLKVKKEGAYTRFVAECPMRDEVIRLSVYGGGVEGYLGVPLPAGGKLRLEKRFSPAALRGFPREIDHCGPAFESQEETVSPAEKADVPKCEEREAGAEPDEAASEPTDEESDGEEGRLWYATTDGALVSREGEREMVALPSGDERVPDNIPGQPRIIEGKEYLVYITK